MKLRMSLGAFIGALVLGVVGLHTLAVGHESAAVAVDSVHAVAGTAGEAACAACADDPDHAAVGIGCILALIGFTLSWRNPERRFWFLIRSRAPGAFETSRGNLTLHRSTQDPPSLTALGISRT